MADNLAPKMVVRTVEMMVVVMVGMKADWKVVTMADNSVDMLAL